MPDLGGMEPAVAGSRPDGGPPCRIGELPSLPRAARRRQEREREEATTHVPSREGGRSSTAGFTRRRRPAPPDPRAAVAPRVEREIRPGVHVLPSPREWRGSCVPMREGGRPREEEGRRICAPASPREWRGRSGQGSTRRRRPASGEGAVPAREGAVPAVEREGVERMRLVEREGVGEDAHVVEREREREREWRGCTWMGGAARLGWKHQTLTSHIYRKTAIGPRPGPVGPRP